MAGCGNAFQYLWMHEWKEVGIAAPPVSEFEEEYVVTTLTPGSARRIDPGDLVQIRIFRPSSLPEEANLPRFQPIVVWLWVGREPESAIVTKANVGKPDFRMIAKANWAKWGWGSLGS